MLYMKGVKYWEYNVWKPDFIGDFPDTFGLFFDKKEYELKKSTAMKRLGRDLRMEKAGVRLCMMFLSLVEKGWAMREIANAGGWKEASDIRKYLKRYDLDGKLDDLLEKRAFKRGEGQHSTIIPYKKESLELPSQTEPSTNINKTTSKNNIEVK